MAASVVAAQETLPPVPSLTAKVSASSSPLPTNSVSHIAPSGQVLWIGTSKGAARSADRGESWTSYREFPEFARPGIYAVAVDNDTVWCATGFVKDVDDQRVQTGAGYTYSLDGGSTWTALPQPLDDRADSMVAYGTNSVRFIPIVVPEQNVTFDLAFGPRTVWAASWAGGIRASTDRGASWRRTVLPSKNRNTISPADSLGVYVIDPRLDNNYLGFSVAIESDSIVWAGTAGGVNRSTDGGVSWTKFTRANQDSSILSDWVIAIAVQRLPTGNVVWTTNWPAEGEGQRYGISSSTDNGASWVNYLVGTKAYGFGFNGSTVYVATDDGLYRSSDRGGSWTIAGDIVDPETGARNVSRQFFAVGAIGDTIFGGNSEGLVRTLDGPTQPFATVWNVKRSFQPVGVSGQTYAYPNPFSPRQEITRVHYATPAAGGTVTIEVFDFGMNRVRTVLNDAPRGGSTEYDDIWDGRDDSGRTVPNGVYFYRVVVGGGEPTWGKIMVLQ